MNNKIIKVGIIIPVFNECDNLKPLFQELNKHLVNYTWQLWLVDDGSTDGSDTVLDKLSAENVNVNVLHFSRNFGHMAALAAGIDHASGNVIIMMDADLQHPPALIPKMIEKWKEGYDIVQCIREDNEHISLFKKMTSFLFYSTFKMLTGMQLEPNAMDFRLLDSQVVAALKNFEERSRFFRGLVWWAGYSRCLLRFQVDKRLHGESKYTFSKMIKFAINGIVSFSAAPLRLIFVTGMLLMIGVVIYSLYGLCMFFFTNRTQPGWLSLLLVTMFFSSVQLVSLGIIGHYMATMYDELKKRPLYLLKKRRDVYFSE